MANVKKCDFCGAIYEGKKSVLMSNDTYSSSLSLTNHGDYSGAAVFEHYELCPKCMNHVVSCINSIKLAMLGRIGDALD